MKKVSFLILAVMVITFAATAVMADTLDNIKKRGALVCGVKDSTPGFGFIDEKTREIVGYDVDFCRYIANKLG